MCWPWTIFNQKLAVTLAIVILPMAAAQASNRRLHSQQSKSMEVEGWVSNPSYFHPFTLPSSPDNWLGGTGNWSTGVDWSAGEPGGGSDVFINTGNDYVTLDTSATINSLTLGGTTGSSTLIEQSGDYALTVNNALTISQSGTLTLAAGQITANANSTNSGMVNLSGGAELTVNGSFTNAGGIQTNYGLIQVSQNFTNSGSVQTPLDSHSTLNVGGQLNNSSSMSVFELTVNGNLTNEARGTLYASGINVGGNLMNAGDLEPFSQNSSFTVSGELINSGTFDVGYSSATVGSLNNTGSISLGQLTVNGNAQNSGGISLAWCGPDCPFEGFTVHGTLTNTATGDLSITGPYIGASIANVVNLGSIYVDKATLTVPPGSHAAGNALSGFLNSGTVTIASGGTITSGVPYTQLAGQTTVDGQLSGNINFAGGSVYGNGGTLTGNVTSNASFNIGDIPMTVGQLSIVGNYTQGTRGSLTFDIASLNSYDVFNVSGHAQLNGLMTVNLLNGYIPQVGNMFDIMNFASESGTFSTVLGLPINNQEHFVLEYNSTNLTLDVVSGPTLQAISGHGSSSGSEPFITSVTDGISFQSTTDSVPSSSVPEPGSLLLFASGLTGMVGRLRRRR